MLTTEHVYIEVRISHVILYAFLDRGYEFPIQGIGAIDWKSLFSIFNAVINLTEQSTICKYVFDRCLEYPHTERFGDVGIRSDFQSFKHIFFISQCSQQNDRNMRYFKITFYNWAEFISTHFGHHYIGYDEIRVKLPYYDKCLLSIRTGLDIIIRFEHINKIIAQIIIVLYYQNTL